MKSALEKWLSPGDEAEEGDIIDEANDSFEDEAPVSKLPWEEEPETQPKKQANYSLNTTKVKQSKGDQFNALFEDED
jgi:hypothetical protein